MLVLIAQAAGTRILPLARSTRVFCNHAQRGAMGRTVMSFRAIGALLCGCVLLFAVPASAVEKKSYQGKNVQWDQKAAAWSKSAGAGENKSYRVKKAYWTEKETGWSRSTIKLKRQNGAYPGSFPNHNYGKTRR